jgi:cystathionine gamma-lyase
MSSTDAGGAGNRRALETRVIHGGQQPDPATGAVMPPVYTSATYVQESPGVHQGYVYSRSRNPTREALENSIADLETGIRACSFASGMAAIATVFDLLEPGDHIVLPDDHYSGTSRLLRTVRGRSQGVSATYADLTSRDGLEAAITPKTKMIFIETPTNPQLKIIDLEMVVEVARAHGLLAVADNTFATPILQRPLEVGFDIVVHSATKYLGGHSDVIGGIVVVGRDEDLATRIGQLQIATGAVSGPFDAYLVLRGIKTLAIRMDRHCENAARVAAFLADHAAVDRVRYPGLETHPGHDVAMRQMDGRGGGMVTFDIAGGVDRARRFLERCRIFALAESLGGVESLAEHPAIMTHASLPADVRQRLGIGDGMIRLSVGIENADDLLADLDQALS